MKQYIFLVSFFFIFSNSYSQALQKGNLDLHAGAGFGVYTFTSNDYEENTTNGVPGLLNLGLAYQVTDGLSLGIDYERNGFVTDSDSNTKAVTQNFSLTVGYNVINGDKNVLQAFFQLGTSSFRFDNFNDQDYLTSRGSQIQLGAAWKHYFGETFGMFLNFSVPYYSYNEFKNSSGDVYKIGRVVNINGVPTFESKVYQAKMVGVNFRAGLAFKFGGG